MLLEAICIYKLAIILYFPYLLKVVRSQSANNPLTFKKKKKKGHCHNNNNNNYSLLRQLYRTLTLYKKNRWCGSAGGTLLDVGEGGVSPGLVEPGKGGA